jgi:ferritin
MPCTRAVSDKSGRSPAAELSFLQGEYAPLRIAANRLRKDMTVISQKLQDAINDQIQAELASEYLYLSMAAYSESVNFKGFAGWLRAQADEERGHALRFAKYLTDRGARVFIKGVEQPPQEFGTPLQTFEHVLGHERAVTARINKLFELAREEKDPATEAALMWFVTEQVEEEATAEGIVETLKRVKESGSALVMLDRQLGKRAGGA